MPTPSCGNTNAGEPLGKVTKYSNLTAPILGCSKELVDILHELCSKFESTNMQDLTSIELLCKKGYDL